jgi:hypothetical protein
MELRLGLGAPDPNDATHLNRIHLSEGDELRTKQGLVKLGERIGNGAGGKVFVLEDDGTRVVKIVRRYRIELKVARMLLVEPCKNVLPVLEVRNAGKYAVIFMPRAEPVQDLHGIDLEALYAPVRAYLARLGLEYTDSRVERNVVCLEGRVRVIDFSHVRYVRRPRRRLREIY